MADDAAAAAAAEAEATAIRIATATAAAIVGAGPPAPPPIVPPLRGGIHNMYGVYIGGSPLGDDYLPTKTLSYHFSSQRRHVKTIGTIESNLIKARDSTNTFKFNGQLEAVVGSATEVGKEKFLVMLKRKVEEHGQETFYHIRSDGKVVDLIDQIHNFTVEQVTTEFNRRFAADPSTNEAYDPYELDEITMSRTLVESLVTAEFFEKIFIRYVVIKMTSKMFLGPSWSRWLWKLVTPLCRTILMEQLKRLKISPSITIQGRTSQTSQLKLFVFFE